VGVIVPRYGHTAVARNRVRRRIREIARREWLPVAWDRERRLDVLIRVRREAYESSFDELRGVAVANLERECTV
jgi:ribonuclease P protein component